MITHRLQTQTIPEPPVKVYRIIALTFLLITVVLLGIVIFTMLKKTEITIVAKEDSKTVNFIVTAEAEKNSDKSLSSIVTSTEFYWTEKYAPTATKEVDGTAKGEVIIYNKLSEAQTLVKTTRLLTPDNKLFRLNDRVTIPAGGQITAEVYADEGGASFDIGPSQFNIPGLSLERQKFVYAESEKPMSGGSGKVGVVSEADYKAGETDFANKTKDEFLKNFEESHTGLDQKIVAVTQSRATSSHAIGAETSEFKISGTSTLIIIFYNENDLSDLIKKEVEKSVDMNSEKIVSIGSEPKLEIAAIDPSNKSAQIQISTEAIMTLDANAPMLNKENFLNKQKGEIERYIVSLPHVTGMEIKFTPSWVSKTPSVADKLKIVVKSVK